MNAVRQHAPGGELIVEKMEMPRPGPGEVLVKMEAAPVNFSDLSFIDGAYGMPGSYPVTPGFEGCGTVVGAGKGLLPRWRMNKVVACTPKTGGNGAWAEYMVTSAARCVPLSGRIPREQGSMLLINPMSAMALASIAMREKHRAVVNNAAASTLGKLFFTICSEHNIEVINIVRRDTQLKALKNLGCTYVLNSNTDTFGKNLQSLIGQLHPTMLLDAVGGEAGSALIEAAPANSTVITYAKLSGDDVRFDPRQLLRKDICIKGFQLGNYLEQKNMIQKLRMIRKVTRFIEQHPMIEIQDRFALEKVKEAIDQYKKNMSHGKVILTL